MAATNSIRHPGAGPQGPQKGAGAHHVQPPRDPHNAARKAAPVQPPPPKKAAAPAKPAKKGHGLLYGLLVAAAAASAIGYFMLRGAGPAQPTPEALVQQIEDTAISAAPSTNIYGGSISADRGSPATVTVGGIPNKVCVSAAWRLARSGVVTINGATPERISAALLAEICNQADANTISWMSKKGM